jgi:hypothetical protein
MVITADSGRSEMPRRSRPSPARAGAPAGDWTGTHWIAATSGSTPRHVEWRAACRRRTMTASPGVCRRAARAGPNVPRADPRSDRPTSTCLQPHTAASRGPVAPAPAVATEHAASHHLTPPRPGDDRRGENFLYSVNAARFAHRSRPPGTPGVRPSAVLGDRDGRPELTQAGDEMRTRLTCHRPGDQPVAELALARMTPGQRRLATITFSCFLLVAALLLVGEWLR